MMEKVRNFRAQIQRNKKDIAIIIVWTIVISLILIKTHQFFYLDNEQFSVYKIPYLQYAGPTFTEFDRLLLLATSFLVGIILVDIKNIVYGYFASMFLSSLIAVVYVFIYIWFTLGLVETLSRLPFGWELALFFGIANVFRFMIPAGMLFCLIGVLTGNIIRTMLKPQ
ncbi:hypothetical protein KAU88_04165 [Candidatus Bathyarchaeota archaeon]|nr:hypothetical protein [Candidatus Bathyarchaeota archaeon]